MGLIFAVPGHIQKIASGEKTETRRAWKDGQALELFRDIIRNASGRVLYQAGQIHAILPQRGQAGVWWNSESKRVAQVGESLWATGFLQWKSDDWIPSYEQENLIVWGYQPMRIRITALTFREYVPNITPEAAQAEGGYTVEEYLDLWRKLNPDNLYCNVIRFEVMK